MNKSSLVPVRNVNSYITPRPQEVSTPVEPMQVLRITTHYLGKEVYKNYGHVSTKGLLLKELAPIC